MRTKKNEHDTMLEKKLLFHNKLYFHNFILSPFTVLLPAFVSAVSLH